MYEPNGRPPPPVAALLEHLARLQDMDDLLPDPSTARGTATREFFTANWQQARDGLLAKTERLRVQPTAPGEAPRVFRFEIDCPYKRKAPGEARVELVEGPLRGTIRYRPDLFAGGEDEPAVAIFLDPDQYFLHPNFNREFGMLCAGELPPGPYPLDALLEHIYWVVTYQNRSTSDPADPEAARYFALEPSALAGLERVEPLY